MKARIYFSTNKNKFFNVRFFSNKISYQQISSQYWASKTPDINSMCGFKELNEEDVSHSTQIFSELKQMDYLKFKSGLDVGAGIGRVTFNFLYDICEQIDLLDANNKFLEQAKVTASNRKIDKISNYFNTKIEDFKFSKTYDLIYCQWVLEYITNKELEKFLTNAKENLEEKGIMIIKENVNVENENIILFKEEGSIVRPFKMFEEIYKKIGFQVLKSNIISYKSVENICEMKYWILKKEK